MKITRSNCSRDGRPSLLMKNKERITKERFPRIVRDMRFFFRGRKRNYFLSCLAGKVYQTQVIQVICQRLSFAKRFIHSVVNISQKKNLVAFCVSFSLIILGSLDICSSSLNDNKVESSRLYTTIVAHVCSRHKCPAFYKDNIKTCANRRKGLSFSIMRPCRSSTASLIIFYLRSQERRLILCLFHKFQVFNITLLFQSWL